ncbi:MAG: hypothetical protein GYB33_01530 [Gammaproteobacteria bacterium]|nr:hypothetical protein [Gammaproteobacteria bacterium]
MSSERFRLTPKSAIELLFARLLACLPFSWTSAIGAFLGELEVRYDARCNKLWVQRFYRNMATLCCATTAAAQRRCLINYGRQMGRVYAEYTVLHKLERGDRIEISGLEHIANQQRPVIFVAPHMANWEVNAKIASLINLPCCGLYEPRESTLRMAIANRARKSWAPDIKLVSTASPMAIRDLTRNLLSGYNLLILPDEERQGYVWAPSLGRKLPDAGNRWLAARLAVKHGVDIVPLCAERLANTRFKVIVGERLSPSGEGSRQAQVQDLAARIDTVLEAWVRKNPEHWFWQNALNLDKPFPAHLLRQSVAAGKP